MKKLRAVILIISLSVFSFDFASGQKLEKRTYYDLFGDSLKTSYRIYELMDINGIGGGYSNLRSYGWGLFGDDQQRVTYSDKSKQLTTSLKIGAQWYYSTEIFNEQLSPFVFNRLRFSGIEWGVKHKKVDEFKLIFSRTMPAGFGQSDKNTYLIALHNEYKLKQDPFNLSLGVSFLNHWKETSLIDENSFDGSVEAKPPSYLYLKFSDDSPEDAYGAALHKIEYSSDGINWTTKNLANTYEGTPDFSSGVHRDAHLENYFIYRLPLNVSELGNNTSTLKKVQFKIDIANDYKIEIYSDLNPIPVMYRAQGNVQDYSNRTTLSVTYGVPSANRIYGFDIKGKIWDLNLDMEYALSQQFRKYPNTGGAYANELSPAFYLKLNYPFFDKTLNIGGDYFYTSPDYSTMFDNYGYISDNDDRDWLPDGELSVGGYTMDPFSPLPMFYDLNSNSKVDWEDAFICYKQAPSKFLIGEDRNNNGVPDRYDDNLKPDYPYGLDLQGYGLFLEYKLLKDINLKLGMDDFKKISSVLSTKNTYFISEYKTKVSGFGPFLIRNEVKNTEDNIPDDLFYEGQDKLLMKNSIINVFYLESNYNVIKGFEFNNKFKLFTNYQYDAGKMNRWSGFISKVSYDYKPIKDWTITPQYKFVYQSGDNEYEQNNQDNIFILKTDYKVFSQTTLTAGTEFRFTRNILNTDSNYNKRTYALQVVSRAGTYQLFTGYKREIADYYNNTSKSERSETIFFGVYHTVGFY